MNICENKLDNLRVDCLLSISPYSCKLCDITVKSHKFFSCSTYYKLVVFIHSSDNWRLKYWANNYGKFGQAKDLKLNMADGNVVVKNAVCTCVTQQAMIFHWSKVS